MMLRTLFILVVDAVQGQGTCCIFIACSYVSSTVCSYHPTVRKLTLEFKFSYFANGKLAKFKFHLLLFLHIFNGYLHNQSPTTKFC